MIWFSFKKYKTSSGKLLIKERVYYDNYKWTPIIKLRFRYVGKCDNFLPDHVLTDLKRWLNMVQKEKGLKLP